MYNIEKMRDHFAKIPYATVYNFQPWTSVNKETDLKTSLKYPYRLLMALRKNGTAKRVPIYPEGEEKKPKRYTDFFTIKNLASDHLSQYQTYDGYISRDMLRHQSGLIDIFMAFINLYPNCTVEIDCNKKFKYEKEIKDRHGYVQKYKKNYIPDAFIKLTTPEQKQYDFIIEHCCPK